jgi:hypothetical protein
MKPLLAVLPLAVAVAFAKAPTPPSDVVYKPTFLTGYSSLTAGTGFVVRLNDQYAFLTAHHLFGPAAGLERDLTPAEAREFAIGLAGSSMNQQSKLLISSQMLFIPSAKAFDQRDASHDIAAFRLTHYAGPALTVAETTPKKGETVYLLGRPRGEEKLRLISAVISRVSTNSIEYFYDEAGVNFAGTSGAPILNESGEVVGMNLGGGELQGKEFGFGNPAKSFAALVTTAIDSAK